MGLQITTPAEKLLNHFDRIAGSQPRFVLTSYAVYMGGSPMPRGEALSDAEKVGLRLAVEAV